MKLFFFIIISIISTGAFGQKKDINEESVLLIKKNKTTELQLKQLFGEPEEKKITSDFIIYYYENDKATLNITISSGNKKVFDFNYTTKSNGKAEDKLDLLDSWRMPANIESAKKDRKDFLELVNKVILNEVKLGAFVYLNYKGWCGEDNSYMTIIGKFVSVNWKSYAATFHTKLGYQLRALYLTKRKRFTKLEKNKYYNGTQCMELIEDYKKPIIFDYELLKSELPIVK